MNEPWRQHFSRNAGDLIAIHRWLCGPAIAQRIMLACFARSPRATRVNEQTVCAVLAEMNVHVDDDGSCFVPADRTATP